GNSGYSEVAGHGFRPIPTRRQKAFHSVGVWLAKNAVSWAVVPEPSDRMTGVIFIAGRATPGLSATIAGSFHCVIAAVKIFAIVGGANRRPVKRLPLMSRWYISEVPPATIGRYTHGRCCASAISFVDTVPVASL